MDNDDSIAHHEERTAKMRAEAKEVAEQAEQDATQRAAQQAERDKVSRNAHADELEARVGIIHENETREMLLERIRKMRNETPPEPVYEQFCHPLIRAQIELEQQAGREAVARAEAEQERMRKAREAAPPDNQAITVPVHHPNPDQSEQYPAVKATLGKPHDRTKTR